MSCFLNSQFGNLLVLQAAYHSPVLRPLINPQLLAQLIDKTIYWFRTLAATIPVLHSDAEILRNTSSKLDFALPPQNY